MNKKIKIGFYKELDSLKKKYPEADFGFLGNKMVTKKRYANEFLHGYCDEFAAMLNEVFGYQIECIRYPENNGIQGRLIHAYCVVNSGDEKYYIDVRGITNDAALFFEEFEFEATYYKGCLYCTNDYGYELEVETEIWANKNQMFDGDYKNFSNEEIKRFIEEYKEYYQIPKHKI